MDIDELKDDREEFEQEQVSRDREGDSLAESLQDRNSLARTRVDCEVEARERLMALPPRAIMEALDRAKFDAALARLDAEVAAHEADGADALAEGYGAGGPDPLLDYQGQIDGTNGQATSTVIDGPMMDFANRLMRGPAVVGEETQFGERLRQWLDKEASRPFWKLYREDIAIVAAAIDQDARTLTEEALARGAQQQALVLRQRVEEAVERLRHTIETGTRCPAESWPRRVDVLDAEPFLERLGGIFGERALGAEPHPTDGDPEPEHSMGFGMLTEDLLEHELASERREREAERNEDSTGRVPGVDR